MKNVLARLYGRKPSALDSADVPLDIMGTAFQWKVWKALTEIPAGQTSSYGEIAKSIGEPKAARAVGRACATNQAAMVIPCHRAVGAQRRAHRLSLGRRAQGAAAGRGTAAQQHVEGAAAAVARVGRPDAAHPAAVFGRFSQPTNSARMRPPSTRPPSRRAPLPVTISTTRKSRAAAASRKRATARSAAARVMPCRSSEACGTSLPRARARAVSRSKV